MGRQNCSSGWITGMCLRLFLSVFLLYLELICWLCIAAFFDASDWRGGEFQVLSVHHWEDGFRISLFAWLFAIAKVDFSFGINNRFKCIIPPNLPIKYFFLFGSQCCCFLTFCLYHCISASLAVHPLLGDSFGPSKRECSWWISHMRSVHTWNLQNWKLWCRAASVEIYLCYTECYNLQKTKDQQRHAVYDTETKEMTPSHGKAAREETQWAVLWCFTFSSAK